MDSYSIQELRKKQFLSINLYSITVLVTAGALIFLLEPSRLIVLLLLCFFMAISCLFTWREMDGKEWRRSDWARQLVAYEKEKMGKEWFKSKRGELTSKLFLIVLFIFQLSIGNASDPFFPDIIGIEYYVFFLLALIILTNVSLYFRNRKIDRLTTVELQGFTKREYGKGMVIGIIFAVIVIVATFNFIISM
ncbi:hypothetical protein [Alkalihalobacterium bogoriense]|uniref:hypothetical protein n=1 Tax=Alkalihalobacterium bogoriense TaxID=246272 RepID=UPI000478C69C|nr:hypothetical protein [Alkalihalobacterium bogoriense]